MTATQERSRKKSRKAENAGSQEATAKKALARRVPKKRPGFIALTVTLAVVGGLSGYWGISTSGQITVLTAKEAMQRGHTIEQGDLSNIRVAKDTPNVIPVEETGEFLGKKVVMDVAPGALINDATAAEEVSFSQNQAIVGVALKPGNLPSRALVAGDKVRVVFTPADPNAQISGTNPIAATVESVAFDESQAQNIVDVRVDKAAAQNIARWSASGSAAIVLDGEAK